MIDFLSSINTKCLKAIVISATTICGVDICTPNNLTSPVVCGTTSVRAPLLSGNTVCSTGSIETPNLQLTSISARTTETAIAYLNSAGCIVSGTSSGGGICGSGTSGYIPQFTGSCAVGDSIIYTCNNYIGIGTITPSTLLQVGDASAASVITINGSAASHQAGVDFQISGSSKWNLRTTGTIDNIGFYDGSSYRLYICRDNGNVGIGGTSPSTTLDVISSNANPLRIYRNGINASYQVTNSVDDVYFGVNSSGNASIGHSLDQSSAPFQVTSGGSVGIGTTLPSNTFTVEKSIAANNLVTINNTSTNQGAGLKIITADAGATALRYGLLVNDDFIVQNGGNVGIGTTSPRTLLDIRNIGTSAFAFENSQLMLSFTTITDNISFAGISFPTSSLINYGFSLRSQRTTGGLGNLLLDFHNNSAVGTNIITVTNSGNVGIGGNPTQKFEVIGSLGSIGICNEGVTLAFSRTSTNYFNATSAGGQFAWRVNAGSTNAMSLDVNSNLVIVGNVTATCFIGCALTAKNSTCLNGQLASYYQAASTAINTSNIGSQSVNYATTAGSAPANGGTANNSICLGGQTAGYYQPASTAINTFNIDSQSVNNSACLGGKIYTLYQGLAEGSSSVDPNTTDDLYILTNHANSPSTSKYWHIRTQYWSTVSSTSNRAQIAIEYNPTTYARMFVRSYYNTVWSTWTEIINQNNIGSQSVNYASTAGNAGTASSAAILCSSGQYAVLPYASSCVQLYYAGVAKFKTLTNGACIIGCGFATDFVASSDRFLKKDIQPISNALSIVNRLCGVCYRMCDDVNNENRVGFIAQEVVPILPEIVSYSEPTEEDKKYGITDKRLGLKYDKLTAILLEAIKEQQLQINSLKEEINAMKNK